MKLAATVNGNTLEMYPHQQGTYRETDARRLAGALERGHDSVERVTPATGGKVNVWLATPTGEGDDTCRRFHAPAGWLIAYTDVTQSGATCLTLTRDE
jgi:hypothetical protein